ncbi:MAG: hypothetical protein ABIH23_33165, partial [bacterium]
LSSFAINKLMKNTLIEYHGKTGGDEPVWQRRYYDFNLFTEDKVLEKLEYIHNNPVKSGLVEKPEDWKFSSSRWYESSEPVGVDIEYPL